MTAIPDRARRRADRRLLANRFPALFSAEGENQPKRPVARNVYAAIRKAGIADENGAALSAARLYWALKEYRDGSRYDRGLLAHDQYFGLDGQPTSSRVSAGTRRKAAIRLARAAQHRRAVRNRDAVVDCGIDSGAEVTA